MLAQFRFGEPIEAAFAVGPSSNSIERDFRVDVEENKLRAHPAVAANRAKTRERCSRKLTDAFNLSRPHAKRFSALQASKASPQFDASAARTTSPTDVGCNTAPAGGNTVGTRRGDHA